MDFTAWIMEYGLWGLAGASFLAATILPFSSEVALVAALRLGFPAEYVLLSASIGNALGASLNYALGRWPSETLRHRLEESRGGRRALRWTESYGKWGLLGSWLPIVGDPLCLAAGLFRVHFFFFVTVGLGTRVARYWVLICIFQ